MTTHDLFIKLGEERSKYRKELRDRFHALEKARDKAVDDGLTDDILESVSENAEKMHFAAEMSKTLRKLEEELRK